jgi:hypothetical protein
MSEDLQRMPDGIPHDVVGLTAFCAIALAVALALAWIDGLHGIAVLVALATPRIVWRLVQRAERERDFVHPSR